MNDYLNDQLKIPHKTITVESENTDFYTKYSSSLFTKKIPKGVMLCDYDKNENLIEVELSNGDRNWVPLALFFGKFIFNVQDIYLEYSEGLFCSVVIVGVEEVKIKRSQYLKLIFEHNLPF